MAASSRWHSSFLKERVHVAPIVSAGVCPPPANTLPVMSLLSLYAAGQEASKQLMLM